MASTPKPPSATSQAAAQQAADMGASWTSSILNNPNQVNPYGTQSYKIAGYEKVLNAKGKLVDVPRYTQTTTLSPEQQKLLDLQNKTMGNVGELGVSQSEKLKGLLGTNLNTQGLTGWQSYGGAPKMQTGYGAGGNIQYGFGDAGKLATSIPGAGKGITTRYGGPTSIEGAGGIQKSIGDGGAIRQDQGPTDRAALERAMLGRYTRDAANQNKAQDAQLAARGVNPGAKQYSNVDEERARNRTDAVQQAYLASGAESRAAQEAYNAAQQQRFGQGSERGQFANAAQAQQFGQNATAASFAADQAAQRAGFANAAQQQAFGQNSANAEFGNSAQAQLFQEMMARAGFGNAAQQQGNTQNAQAAQFGNAARQQDYSNRADITTNMNNLRNAQLQERIAVRNQPLNEIMALLGGSGVTMPQFEQMSRQGVNAAPIGQYMGQNYANQVQSANNFNQGLFGLGGGLAGGIGQAGGLMSFFSDRDVKEDVRPTGTYLAGLPLYTFRYVGSDETHTGVMADEARELHPNAVGTDPDTGFDMVDYGKLLEAA